MVRHAGHSALKLFASGNRLLVRINITSTRSHYVVHGDRVFAKTRSSARMGRWPPSAASCRHNIRP